MLICACGAQKHINIKQTSPHRPAFLITPPFTGVHFFSQLLWPPYLEQSCTVSNAVERRGRTCDVHRGEAKLVEQHHTPSLRDDVRHTKYDALGDLQ